MSEDEQGVVFPAGPDGRRSTSALGRAVVADALRPVDAGGAPAAERETNWRAGYLTHFRRLVEAGLPSGGGRPRGRRARAWLAARRMRVADRTAAGLDHVCSPAAADAAAAHGRGHGDRGARAGALAALPRRAAARRRPAARSSTPGSTAGVVEPSCAEAVRTVAAHPDWLSLPDSTVVVLGAGAEMGPLHRAAAVGRPGRRRRPAPRRRSGSGCSTPPRGSAGTLLVPVDDPAAARPGPRGRRPDHRAARGRRVAGGPARAAGARQLRLRPRCRPTCGSPRPSTPSPCA